MLRLLRVKSGGRTIRCEIHVFINSIWNKEDLPGDWKESIIVPKYKEGKKQTVVIIEAYHFCQLAKELYPTFCCQV